MEMAIAKAKAGGLSAASMSRTSHVGRLADYVEMAAAAGLVGMVWANPVHGLNVAPWGGAARRLGTHPHAVGIPDPAGPAMVLDFAHQRRGRGETEQGRAATDPEVFYGDPPGALLTAGDHKGYGLSLAVEILGASSPAPAPRVRRPASSPTAPS
jgi:hydroxycarboxylate dehydrogenase B